MSVSLSELQCPSLENERRGVNEAESLLEPQNKGGVGAECQCQLSPPPLLCGPICGEFLISQALGCLHTSQPQASQEALPVGGKEGGREVLSCPGHSLAFATLSFLQPLSPSSWRLRATGHTHPGPVRTLEFPQACPHKGKGKRQRQGTRAVGSPATSSWSLRPGSPPLRLGRKAALGSLGGCPQQAVPGASVRFHPSTGMFEVLLNSLLEFLCLNVGEQM